jgi:molecular chaperone DnaK
MQILSKAVGIDLGTTNSAVAMMNATDTDLVIYRDPTMKSETTPSCVWKNAKSGEIVVGRQAFRRIGTAPSPVRSIKRSMGRQIKVKLTDEDATPELISSYILREMRRQIETNAAAFSSDSAKWIVDRAVITIPAYFDQPQVEATRQAGILANLEVLDLLHEPTAAACYHCWKTGTQDGVFLVYDFGGGTFDVSVLRATAGAFEVLGIGGNNYLGGDDLDTMIAEALQERLLREGYALDLDVRNDPEDGRRFDKLRLMAEGVKKALSTAGEYLLRDTSSLQDKNGDAVTVETMFERPEVEDLMRPAVERTIPYCYDALEKAGKKGQVTLADVDAVILAGGSTHIPLVREMVRRAFCADPAGDGPRAKCAEPVYEKVDTVVALGAAIRAAAQGGLAVYNPERTVRVSFRGTGATGSRETHIGGKAEALASGIELSGGRVRLSIPDAGYEDELALKDGGAFAFRAVPLQQSAENLISFEIYDAAGTLVATAGRPIRQSQEPVRPTGGSTSTAPLNKPFLLEVERKGKPSLREIAAAGVSLPYTATFKFTHPGNTESVRMPLYQVKRKIKEIVVPVDKSMPKGTPIELNVNIDAQMLLSIQGKVGDVPFDAVAEAPPERAIPDDNEVSALDARFREEIAYVAAGKKMPIEARYKKAKASLEAARKRSDQGQAVHDIEEMEEIVASISRADGQLQPPRDFFEDQVKECFDLNRHLAQESAKGGRNYDHREVEKAIEAQRVLGEKAFRDADQKTYSDVIMQLEALKNHMIAIYQKISDVKDTRTDEQRASDNVKFAGQEAGKVGQLAAAQKRPDLEKEAAQLTHELQDLAQESQKNPHAVQEKVQKIRGRLEQIKNFLMGKRGGEGGDLPQDDS